MQEVILLKNGEIVLKGLNRPQFEDMLVRNIKRRLEGIGVFCVSKAQSTMTITPGEDFDIDRGIEALKKIFGIVSISRACVVEKDMDVILKTVAGYVKEPLSRAKTFKVEAKRSDKKFPLGSPKIAAEVGAVLLDAYPNLTVDVHNPEIVVYVEIRDYKAYIHAGSIKGAGGMPVGSNSKAALMISGGIDSPVAGYMMAKRGMELCAVHFASPPYTSERAKNKVIELLKTVAEYSGRITTFVVPFTRIQEEIRNNCAEEYFTIIMRRLMIEITCRIAKEQGALALITGESIGQVASQTAQAILCTDVVSDIPVYRPLIGMDKEEIITIARRIDTFETSQLPYEDCCTVFTPKHPRTRPRLDDVVAEEQKFDFGPLLDEAVTNTEKIVIN